MGDGLLAIRTLHFASAALLCGLTLFLLFVAEPAFRRAARRQFRRVRAAAGNADVHATARAWVQQHHGDGAVGPAGQCRPGERERHDNVGATARGRSRHLPRELAGPVG